MFYVQNKTKCGKKKKIQNQNPNAICPNQTTHQTNTNEFQNFPYYALSNAPK